MLDFGKNKNSSGQSLMETIIAVGLVMTVVISSITMGIYTTRLGRGSQNNLVAVNLAREGLEVVRNIRDSNWLNNVAWDSGLTGCSTNYCIVDPLLTYVGATGQWVFDKWQLLNLDSCSNKYNNEACLIKRSIKTTGCPDIDCLLLYNHRNITTATNIATIFYRGVKIVPDANGLTVTAKVIWKENSLDKTITLEEYLTNWRYE